jgi:hypothetical protein
VVGNCVDATRETKGENTLPENDPGCRDQPTHLSVAEKCTTAPRFPKSGNGPAVRRAPDVHRRLDFTAGKGSNPYPHLLSVLCTLTPAPGHSRTHCKLCTVRRHAMKFLLPHPLGRTEECALQGYSSGLGLKTLYDFDPMIS